MKLVTAIWCLVCGSLALGQSTYSDKPPTEGEWKGQTPGTWVLTKRTNRDADKPTRVDYQREMLVGSNETGKAWLSLEKSDSPQGPWQHVFDHGGGRSSYTKVTPLGEQTLQIGETKSVCAVTRSEGMDDASNYEYEEWKDATTGVTMQSTQTIHPRDADAPVGNHVNHMTTVAIVRRRVNEHDCMALVQEATETFNGAARSSYRTVVSPDVPGQRISFTRWSGSDTSAAAQTEAEVLSWGKDPALLAEHRTKFASFQAPQQQTMTKLREEIFADAESADVQRRARGLSTIGMNRYPESYRKTIERLVQAGLVDAEVQVRRAAAEAAGFHQVPGCAAHIVELSKADAQGAAEYLRALGRLADPVGLDIVLAAAKSTSGFSCDLGVEALANFSDARAASTLKELLASSDRIVRNRVVRYLGRGRSPDGTQLLLSVTHDADERVRGGVMMSLGERGDPRGLDAAIEGMKDASPQVRLLAVSAVARLGETPGKQRQASEALLPLLDEKVDPQLRLNAAFGLAKLKDARVLPLLKAFAALPPGKDDREFIPKVPTSPLGIAGLKAMGTPEALAALAELARDPQHAGLALPALRDAKSPQGGRIAWDLYRQGEATRPSSGPSASTRPGSSDDGWHRSQLLTLVIEQADRSLRDEIEAGIATAPVFQRPDLRRLVRAIDEKRAAATQPGARD